jgi:hypothetical protein
MEIVKLLLAIFMVIAVLMVNRVVGIYTLRHRKTSK